MRKTKEILRLSYEADLSQRRIAQALNLNHAFIAPVGFQYEKSKTQGKVLVKDEPVASVIAEMMEGFASGRFQAKSECKYFLENSPVFPKTKSGKIGNSQVDKLLSNPLYAAYIEYRPWNITLRKGQHEGMVSYEAL